jgi:hypothetical protein
MGAHPRDILRVGAHLAQQLLELGAAPASFEIFDDQRLMAGGANRRQHVPRRAAGRVVIDRDREIVAHAGLLSGKSHLQEIERIAMMRKRLRVNPLYSFMILEQIHSTRCFHLFKICSRSRGRADKLDQVDADHGAARR